MTRPAQQGPGDGDERNSDVNSGAEIAGLLQVSAAPPKLPETVPPAGLPISAWGPRDCVPVIRNPWYVSAQQADSLLAADEPVLGVVIGDQVRAYSTNQLNDHEMVLDEIAGTPFLVSY
jgi:hypothetical protein